MKAISLTLAVATLVLAGCSSQTRDEYSQAGSEAGQALKTDLSKGEKAAKAAGDAASISLKEDEAKTKKAAGNASYATMTLKIKSALDSASDLNAGQIKVETVGTNVKLSGTVPNANQKTRALEIAKGIAGTTYHISSSLSVAAG